MSANDELQAHTCEKMLEEYGNVANNVAQGNSQDLTEQWKKGELSEGYYYFKMPDGAIEIASEYKLIRYKLTKDADKIEVIAPVPNYEKWQELSNQRNQLIRDVKDLAYIQEENQQLKELLKECQQSFRGIRVQIEEFEYSMARKTAQIAIDEIDNALGEKK